MLVVNKAERDKCHQVRKKLWDLYEKCKSNPEFATSSISESSVLPNGASSRGSGVTWEGIPDEQNNRSATKQRRKSLIVRAKTKMRSWFL